MGVVICECLKRERKLKIDSVYIGIYGYIYVYIIRRYIHRVKEREHLVTVASMTAFKSFASETGG